MEEILAHKYQTQTLAHLYMLEPQYQNNSAHCYNVIKKFLGSLTPNPDNHSDILFIQRPAGKNYLLEEIQPFYDFIRHPALEFKNKFLVLDEVHRLTETAVNKLLKDLEEPPVPMTIFLINSHKKNVLATLKSRSILLRIPMQLDNSPKKEIPSEPLSFEQFCQDYLATPADLHEYTQCVNDLLVNTKDSNSMYEQYKSLLKSIEQDISLNNPWHQSQFKLYAFTLNNLLK